eukprot:3174852-Prymnesium_polylepis.1
MVMAGAGSGGSRSPFYWGGGGGGVLSGPERAGFPTHAGMGLHAPLCGGELLPCAACVCVWPSGPSSGAPPGGRLSAACCCWCGLPRAAGSRCSSSPCCG